MGQELDRLVGRRLRIVTEGHAANTHVYDLDSGLEIGGVARIEFSIDADRADPCPKLTLWFNPRHLELIGEVTTVLAREANG